MKAHAHSFLNQHRILNKRTKMSDCTADTTNTIEIINSPKTLKNMGQIESNDFVIDFYIAKGMFSIKWFT
jgi:hypothetical protein